MKKTDKNNPNRMRTRFAAAIALVFLLLYSIALPVFAAPSAIGNPNAVPYKILLYTEKLNSDEYTLYSTQTAYGEANSEISPAPRTITGFITPEKQTVTLSSGSTTVISYYYTRQSYSFTLGSADGIDTTGSTSSGLYKYGTTITLKANVAFDSQWGGWKSSDTTLTGNLAGTTSTFNMPAGAVTMTPSREEVAGSPSSGSSGIGNIAYGGSSSAAPSESIASMNDKIYSIYKLIRNNLAFPLLALSFASCGFKILGASILGSGAGTDRGIQAAKEQIAVSVFALLLILALPHIISYALDLFKANAWQPPGAVFLPIDLTGGVYP